MSPFRESKTFAVVVLTVLLTIAGVLIGSDASAVPTLQLDIGGGVYDPVTQTIVSTSDAFTLYAILHPGGASTLSTTYYISAALFPEVGPDSASLGSFVFGGSTVNVTSDMTYGRPPIEATGIATSDAGDLPRHGIFPTYFSEFGFTFNPANTATIYNTQDNPGGPTPNPLGTVYYAAFDVDISGLSPSYVLHFDLYNTRVRSGGDIDVRDFAPFSHDAEGRHQVPEPASVLLLGSGLVGLGLLKRKFFGG